MRGQLAILFLVAARVAGASDGATLYGQYCQVCHGLDAAGLAQYDGDSAAFARVLEGETAVEMPDFYGVFDDADIDALFEFVRSSAEPRSQP